MVYYGTDILFTDASSTSAIWITVDPDGQYGGSTTGPSKSTSFYLYYNGRLVSRNDRLANTYAGGAGPQGPDPGADPEYFSWSN